MPRHFLRVEDLEAREVMDAAYHLLSGSGFTQDWTADLITADDDWSGVPAIIGYRGDGLTVSTGTNPGTVLASSAVADVIANRPDATETNGGVGEFELPNRVVGLQGSATADAPYLQLHIDTTGTSAIRVRANLRDLDDTADNAVQAMAVQYRIGESGPFTNLPTAFVPDASSGPGLATLVTPVNVILPADADNQPRVQIRFITANATGNNEWIGIDDIIVRPDAPPTDISLSGNTVDENLPTGTAVGTFSTTDTDSEETFSYALVTGAGSEDNDQFTVDGNILRTAAPFDVELKAVHAIRVRTTDAGGKMFEKQFNIMVNNVNDAPVNTLAATYSGLEDNQLAITGLAVADADAGTANVRLTLSVPVGTGTLRLKDDTGPGGLVGADITGQNTREIIVNAPLSKINATLAHAEGFKFNPTTDSHGAVELTMTSEDLGNTGGGFKNDTDTAAIMIEPINDSPTLDNINNPPAIDEDTGEQTISLTGISPGLPTNESGQVLTVTAAVTAGNPALFSSLTVTGSGANRSVKYTPAANAFGTVVITVTVKDDGLTDHFGIDTYTDTFTVVVNPLNDAPIFNDRILVYDTNMTNGTLVGTVAATDADPGDILTYGFESGNTSGAFAINAAGQITVANASALTAGTPFTLVARVTDNSIGNLSDTATITIKTDAAPTVVGTGVPDQAKNEDAPAFTVDLAPHFTDNDPPTLTFGVQHNSATSLVSASITGTMLTLVPLANQHGTASLTIRATDSFGQFVDDTFNVVIASLNDAPTLNDIPNPAAIPEDSSEITVSLGWISPGPANESGQSLTVTTSSGNESLIASSSITVTGSGTTRDIKFTPAANASGTAVITVRVEDNGGGENVVEKTFTVTVNAVNDPPTDVSLDNTTVAENLPVGTTVGTFDTTDVDAADGHAYSFATGPGDEDNGRFALSAAGALTTGEAFNFEARSSYSILVRSVETGVGGLSFSKAFTITVGDVNETPMSLTLDHATITENAVIGTIVGTISTTDPDLADSHTYTLANGPGDDDNDRFSLNSLTGSLTTLGTFDFEVRDNYSILVRSEDTGGRLVEKAFAISIADANDAPTIGGPYAFFYHHALPAGSEIGTVSATDQDASDHGRFSITGGDTLGVFAIDPDTGVLTLPDATRATGSFNLTIRVTDDGGLFDETTVNITRNDPPTLTTPIPDQATNEDTAFALDLATFFADNETLSGDLVFEVVSNSAVGLVSVSSAGSVLTLTPQADQFGTAAIVVRATDTAGQSVTDAFDVVVAAVNDPPTLADIPDPSAVNEEAGEQTVTLAGITTGLPANESGQTVSVTAAVTAGNMSLLSAINPVFADGVWSLKYTLTPNANGTAVVTVTVKDNGETAHDGVDTIQKNFTVAVNAVNDPPVINIEPGVIVEIIPPKATVFHGSPVSVLTANITDADAGSPKGVAITSAPTDDGRWEFSTDAGANWRLITGISDTNALLLADLPANRVRFAPNPKLTGFASLEYRAWDTTAGASGTIVTPGGTAFGTATEKASVAVGKTTPTIDRHGNPLFTSIRKDSPNPSGDQVKTLLGLLATDNDRKTVLGLAVTDVDNTNGKWQWQSGGKWFDITGVSDTSALLLGPTTKARFLPNPGFFGEAKLGYHAWDRSVGQTGERATVTGTAFSEAGDFAAIHVIAKPVLDISAQRTPGTATVGDLLAGVVSDVLPGDVVGIAVTGVTGKGTWSYQGGTIKATTASALLLPADAVLRFTPVSGFNGLATLSYRAWNATTLPGVRANASGHAFSTATETLSLFVGGNTAPTIGMTTVNLGKIIEDPKINPGVTVASLVRLAKITDANKTDKKGIALAAADNANGGWQFTLDGKSWADVGMVSASSALALADTAKLRFVPNAHFNGTATIGFKAWDGTIGASGDIIDSTAGSAFSTGLEAIVTGELKITAVNDLPVLDNTRVKFLRFIAAGASSATVTVAELAAGATDVETANIGIAVTAASGPGRWQVSTNDGATFANLKLPSLLPSTAVLRFVGDPDKTGLAVLTFQAWDGTTTSAARETLTVEVGNQAPTLNGPGSLTAITQALLKTNPGDTVGKFLGTTFGDSGVGKKGIAVTGVDAKSIGEWQCRLSAGKPWEPITGVSNATALLLPDSARIRFVPAKDGFSVPDNKPMITYKAWDQTVGSSGERADTTDGRLNAFSGSVISMITVIVAPTLDTSRLRTLPEGGSVTVVALLAGAASSPVSDTFGIAVTGLTGLGVWEHSSDGFAAAGITKVSPSSALLLSPTTSLRFIPAPGFTGPATLSYKAWDKASGNFSGMVNTASPSLQNFFSTAVETLNLTLENDRPELTTL